MRSNPLRLGYAQWIVLMLAGLALAATISRDFLFSALGLWLMGCIYNIPPVRSKDLPYIDVLSESVNNPLRFLLGWYMINGAHSPRSRCCSPTGCSAPISWLSSASASSARSTIMLSPAATAVLSASTRLSRC